MKYLILPVIMVWICLTACKKSSDSAVPVTQSHFMFFNAVSTNAQFNIMLDTIPFASNIGYGTGTGYKQFRAQKYNIHVFDTRFPSISLFSVEINLRNNRYYTAYLGADSTKTQLVLRMTEDDLSLAGSSTAKFRVMNLSQAFKPNGSPLGIDIYSDTFPRFFRGISFTSLTPFAELHGDSSYVLNFRWSDSSKVLQPVKLVAKTGKVYTLITAGNPLDSLHFKIFTVQHN